jgi:hypothetical protein
VTIRANGSLRVLVASLSAAHVLERLDPDQLDGPLSR